MIVVRDIAITCKLNYELEDIVITYMHIYGEKQKTTPLKINDQLNYVLV